MVIYELAERKEDWFVKAEPEWGRGALGMLFCRGCVRVRRNIHPRPIDVKLRYIRPRRSIAFVSQLTIGVIHRRLLDQLEDYMLHFALGNVYDEEGARMENFKTFYAADSIIVRGSAGSEAKQCPICGEIFYPPEGDRYVLRRQLRSHHVYYETGQLHVDEWLAARIDWSKFRDIELVPYPVRDRPEDGYRLPGDPDWSLMGLPCREPTLKVCRVPGIKNVDLADVPLDAGRLGESVDSTTSPTPRLRERPMHFRYFAGPEANMAHFAGETEPCSLCGQTGPCFELEDAICPEIPQDEREGRIGCFDCLRAGRFEFVHTTEIGTVNEEGLRNERTGKLYLPKGFPEGALVELRRTPPIAVNQEEIWLTHCNDFMVYEGVWEPGDFCKHAPDGDGRALFVQMTAPDRQGLWEQGVSENEARAMWYGTYYVFRCLHCGQRRGDWDVD